MRIKFIFCLLFVTMLLVGCDKSDDTKNTKVTSASINNSNNKDDDLQLFGIPELIGTSTDEALKILNGEYSYTYDIEATITLSKQEAINQFLIPDESNNYWFGINILPDTLPIGVSFNNGSKYDSLSYTWLFTNNDRVYAFYGVAGNGGHIVSVKELLEILTNNRIELLSEPTVTVAGDTSFYLKYSFNNLFVQMLAFKPDHSNQYEDFLPIDFIIYDKELDDKGLDDKEILTKWDYSDFAPVPFTIEEFSNYYTNDEWYDNGIFSTYMDMAYPNDTWEYCGTFDCNMPINPFGYTGFDIYLHEHEKTWVYTYVVPISPATPPEVYALDETNEEVRMKLVWANGELLE